MGKRKQNSAKKNILLQWIVPAIVFFVVVTLMLYHYGTTQSERVNRETEAGINAVMKGYSTKASGYLKQVGDAQDPIAVLLDKEEVGEDEQVQQYLSALLSTNLTYAAVMVDENGKGISNMGEPVQINIEEFHLNNMGMGTYYIYLKDDGISNNSAIAVATPLNRKNGYVISYLKPDLLKKYINISDYDGRTWFALIDAEGNMIYSSTSKLSSVENFYDYMEEVKVSSKSIEKVKEHISLEDKGNIVVPVDGKEIYCAFTALDIGEWSFVMGITNHYVEIMRNSAWSATRTMVINMVIALAIFFTLVVVMNVLSKLKYYNENKELEAKADTDQLTELNNKMATERKIKEYIAENPDGQALMFVLDIDNFKKINDTRGHAFGDEVLRTIGMRLKAEFRMTDIIGRLGGDEFVIFLKDIKDDATLKKEADKVAGIFKDMKVGQYSKYKVTASIGCAVFSRDADNFQDLYKAADKGLYLAKKRGKNQLAFYGEE
ncbi:MAG: GGDEF domain-containing protein [Lachnospiraceae bacterium]|nr:GGDEF domain-containing protein [Lachnospiraceae bacterium]